MKVIEKYLEKYAEKESLAINSEKIKKIVTVNNCLVVPLFDEKITFFKQFESRTESILIIAVVNAPENGYGDAISRTRDLLESIIEYYTCKPISDEQVGVFLGTITNNCSILVIDRVSDSLLIPKKKGVGLARKIGSDIALKLIYDRVIISRWIHSTDADAVLPNKYFDIEDISEGAAVYPFKHSYNLNFGKVNEDVISATEIYEKSLHYYVNGLKWAGSIYSFHTIGSCLAVRSDSYARVRGFPQRAAGEDFYLLNKVAKVDGVNSLTAPEIIINIRESERVPFGTGPAVRKIAENGDVDDGLLFYSPETFVSLKEFLSTIELTWNDCNFEFRSVSRDRERAVIEALGSLGFEEFLLKCFKQCSSFKQFERFFIIWFDAFRTLKFIHFLRDHFFPSVTYKEAKDETEFEF